MTLIYLGLAVAANAPVVLWLFVPLIMTIHYGVIVREERYMADKFGVAYINYVHNVPRWL
jgi:protein-S-isoprenylcysteine O-methyltransferase Ste14